MHIGVSRQRLSRSDMPKHEEVLRFAERFAQESGYNVLSQQISSRVVLLSKLSKPLRVGKGCPNGWRTPYDKYGEEEDYEYRIASSEGY